MGTTTSAIVKDMEHCYVCGSPYVQIHHILYGVANRKISDKYGYIVPLCIDHHTGNNGVHCKKPLDLHLKKKAQKHFEANYGNRSEFIATFGKSYL